MTPEDKRKAEVDKFMARLAEDSPELIIAGMAQVVLVRAELKPSTYHALLVVMSQALHHKLLMEEKP